MCRNTEEGIATSASTKSSFIKAIDYNQMWKDIPGKIQNHEMRKNHVDLGSCTWLLTTGACEEIMGVPGVEREELSVELPFPNTWNSIC